MYVYKKYLKFLPSASGLAFCPARVIYYVASPHVMEVQNIPYQARLRETEIENAGR